MRRFQLQWHKGIARTAIHAKESSNISSTDTLNILQQANQNNQRGLMNNKKKSQQRLSLATSQHISAIIKERKTSERQKRCFPARTCARKVASRVAKNRRSYNFFSIVPIDCCNLCTDFGQLLEEFGSKFEGVTAV